MVVITSTPARSRFAWLLALAGCKGQDAAPELFPLADAQTAVGAELLIVLGATDPDGDPLTWAFRSDERVTAGATLELGATAPLRVLLGVMPGDVCGGHGAARVDLRVSGTQRFRQDDDHPHGVRSPEAR